MTIDEYKTICRQSIIRLKMSSKIYIPAVVILALVCTITGVGLILTVMLILILYLVQVSMLSKNQRNLMMNVTFLNDECDPKKFLDSCRFLLNEIDHAGRFTASGNLRLSALFNIATAQIDLGNLSAARQVYDKIGRIPPQWTTFYWNNLATIAYQEGNLEELKNCYESMKVCKGAQREAMLISIETQIAELEGNYDLVLENQDLLQAATNSQSIEQNYTVGHILLLQGKTEEAKVKLEYVIEHGNTMYQVEKAKQLLNPTEVIEDDDDDLLEQ